MFIASVCSTAHRVTIAHGRPDGSSTGSRPTLAVFLIHTHPRSPGALKGIVHTERYVDSPLMLVGLLIIPPVIYALCMVVEQLRLWITKPVLNSERLNAKFAEWDERSEFNEVA